MFQTTVLIIRLISSGIIMESGKKGKEQIIEVTLKLIAEEGTGGITIRQIAKKAEVNVAAVNYHFGSKDNLISQSMEYFSKKVFSNFKILEQIQRTIDGRDVHGGAQRVNALKNLIDCGKTIRFVHGR